MLGFQLFLKQQMLQINMQIKQSVSVCHTLTSDQSNLTWDRIATADGWFNRIRQVAPMWPPMWVHWRHLMNTIELVLHSAYLSPQPKRLINWFSRFCTTHGRKSPYLTMGNPSPKIAPFHGSIWTPSNSWFLGPVCAHNLNGITIGSAVFTQVTAECPYTLQQNASFPLKISLSHGGIWTPSNTWFPGPTWVLNPNAISIGSVVFAGLTNVTDRQTDRPR